MSRDTRARRDLHTFNDDGAVLLQPREKEACPSGMKWKASRPVTATP